MLSVCMEHEYTVPAAAVGVEAPSPLARRLEHKLQVTAVNE